ncbi:MAG: tetratricopeptide repeat protein [bacterium]
MHVMQWIAGHWIGVLEIIAVGAVAIAVIIGADAYGRHRAEAAALKFYEAGKLTSGSDDRINALKEIAKKYSRTSAGRQAIMQLGDILVERGDGDGAIEQFRLLADGSRSQPIFRVAALHRIADIQLAAGNPAEAAETYRKAAADPKNGIALTSELLAAACLERAGDFAAAAELYKRIIQDAGEGDRAVRDASEERLLWLSANGYVAG